MCGSGFVFLAGRLFPGPTVAHSSSLWLMSLCWEAVLSPSLEHISCKPSQQKTPEEQMFLFKADRNCRDHFSLQQFSSASGSCLPGAQTQILMRFVTEQGLQDRGLTNTRTRLLMNPRRELAISHFYIVWRRNNLFSGVEFDILKSIINGNCRFSLISAGDCSSA